MGRKQDKNDMYIEQGYKGLHEGWRYVVGILIVFFGWQVIGSIPIIVALVATNTIDGAITGNLSNTVNAIGKNPFFLVIMLSFVAAFFFLMITVRILHQQKWKDFTTSRPKIDFGRVVFAFGLWLAISIGFIMIDLYENPENYELIFDPIPFALLLLMTLIFIPIQTSFEEYFTRGYLMQGIGIASKNRWLPFLVSSTLFGLLHLFNPEVEKLGYVIMVYYVGTGFFLGILTLMDEGLELALGFHAANNIIAAVLVTTEWGAFQTEAIWLDKSDPEVGWDILIPILIIYPLLLFIFSKKYEWNNWKERLFGRVLSKEEYMPDTNEDTSQI